MPKGTKEIEWVSEWVSYLLYFYKVITRRLVSYREMLYLIKYRFNFLWPGAIHEATR